ncbi:thiamine pyrophosphokinase-related protein [Hypoxylon argillaceum]|nr:thiamine pyrophosphokinase-related protein [Hypoxylon argillaceum]
MTFKSNLDLLNACDDFPLAQKDLAKYTETVNRYYHFKAASVPATLGLVIPSVAQVFGKYPGWTVDEGSTPKTLILTGSHDETSRSKLVAETLQQMRSESEFDVLKKWRNELKPSYGPSGELLFSMERAAVPLLGLVAYGIHMVAYTRPDPNEEPQIWISKRSKKVKIYPGYLDNTVAGGISTGETPYDSLIREAHEEASLPSYLVRRKVKSCGTLSYFHIRNAKAGGEVGLLQLDIHFLFEIELPTDVKLALCDDEVEWYQLWTVDQVKDGLAAGQFKPNFALVMLDFFIRHGILNELNEPNFVEISARLHRVLEFPVDGATSSKGLQAKV